MRLDNSLSHAIARLGQREVVGEINLINLQGGSFLRPAHPDFAIDAARPQNRRVDQVGAIGGQDDHDILQRLDAVHLGAEHGYECGENVSAHAHGVARAQDGLSFIDEKKRQMAFGGFLPALHEQVAHLPLGFPKPHV